jgi:hypothetical protein
MKQRIEKRIKSKKPFKCRKPLRKVQQLLPATSIQTLASNKNTKTHFEFQKDDENMFTEYSNDNMYTEYSQDDNYSNISLSDDEENKEEKSTENTNDTNDFEDEDAANDLHSIINHISSLGLENYCLHYCERNSTFTKTLISRCAKFLDWTYRKIHDTPLQVSHL